MKTLSLDLGDQWTGIAISDALSLLARPLKTVATKDLEKELKAILSEERIRTLVAGLPITMKGTESAQTKKVKEQKQQLEKLFPDYEWVSWDERLTSKQAQKLKAAKTKEQKLQSHAQAAAFILQSYLDYKNNVRTSDVI